MSLLAPGIDSKLYLADTGARIIPTRDFAFVSCYK